MNIKTLNEIQELYFNLDPDDPKEKQQAIFDRMDKETPKRYLSISKDGLRSCIISNGWPISQNMPIKDAIALAKTDGVDTSIVWQCPEWVKLQDVTE